MSLTFNNVGIHMDFGVFAAQKGTFTIGLGRFFGDKPAGQNVRLSTARRPLQVLTVSRSMASSMPQSESASTSFSHSQATSRQQAASRLASQTRSG